MGEEELAAKIQYYRLLEENFKLVTNLIQERQEKLLQIKNLQLLIKDVSSEIDSFINLVGLIFLKARITDAEKFLVNVGNNILIEKNKKETLEYLEKIEKELEEEITKLERNRREIYSTLKGLEEEIQKSVEKKQ